MMLRDEVVARLDALRKGDSQRLERIDAAAERREADKEVTALIHSFEVQSAAREYLDDIGADGEFIYMLVCQDQVGPAYIKFGIANNLRNRIDGLQTGCPIPIQVLGFVEVWTRPEAAKVERSLHSVFDSRRVTGEWFRFDLEKDKKEFQDGCRAVFSEHLPDDVLQKWTRLDIDKSVESRGAAIDSAVFKARKAMDNGIK
jgi:hypothetical protein